MTSSSDRPVFVLGCPRSGTTLLQLMLHSHNRIAIPPETRFLLYAYKHRQRFGDLRKTSNRRKFGKWLVKRKKNRFNDLGLDPQETIDEIAGGPPTLGSALGIVFRAYARRFDSPRWGDKRPAYHQHIPTLLRLFPNAQIIHLIRDGRDCVGSLKNMSWFPHDSYHAISTWAEAIDYTRAAARRLGPDTFYEMYYENLIVDPEKEAKALCDFLGEEYDPAMCTPSEIADIAVPKRKTHHENTHREINTRQSGSWQHRLEPWEVQLCETVLGKRLRSHGYELSGASRPDAGHLARYAKATTQRRLSRRKDMAWDVWRRRTDRSPELRERITEAAQRV